MSLTYGFYNSLNNDRRYDATQMSSLFDGLIRDGIFSSIGSAMVVTADTGLTVKVGTGRAWFNHTWTLNDAILPLTAEDSELLLDRIDAVVLEVNFEENVRANDIKIVKGTPASSPARPEMINTELVHQYPLCYIYRAATSTEITELDITNAVGTSECPFVTGILSVVTIDDFIAQWRAEFDLWMSNEQSDYTQWFETVKAAMFADREAFDQWMVDEKAAFVAWFEGVRSDMNLKQEEFDTWMTNEKSEFNTWMTNEKSEFDTWFESIKGQLSGDLGANLQIQIDDHKNNKNNPHGVTAEQIGAAPASHVENKENPHGVTAEQIGAASKNHDHLTITNQIAEHVANKNNPHGVTAAQIGAAPTNHGDHVRYAVDPPEMDGVADVGGSILVAREDHRHPTDTSRAPAYSYGTTDLTAGSSALATGKLHFVYE